MENHIHYRITVSRCTCQLWGSNGLNSGTTYTGSNAVQAWNEDVNCGGDGLPLESDQSHWNEDCLGNELMTPVLRFKQDWIVSSVTMGALEGEYL